MLKDLESVRIRTNVGPKGGDWVPNYIWQDTNETARAQGGDRRKSRKSRREFARVEQLFPRGLSRWFRMTPVPNCEWWFHCRLKSKETVEAFL